MLAECWTGADGGGADFVQALADAGLSCAPKSGGRLADMWPLGVSDGGAGGGAAHVLIGDRAVKMKIV